jgi:VWFA-related protein
MMRLGFTGALLGLLLASGEGTPAQEEELQRPRDIGKVEKVEVRLVTIDVLVLDGEDRARGGLARGDFELRVDGEPRAIDTLDVDCSEEVLEEPRPTARFGGWEAADIETAAPRRIVFALDYLHLPQLPCPDMTRGPCMFHTRVLEDLRRVVPWKMQAGENVMVAALTGGLRVEQPFTGEVAEVLRTLERMEYDVTLWAGNFDHLTEAPLFRSLETLVDVLGEVPGPKAVVLFSGGQGPGLDYDEDYRQLASRAAGARVSFYTVDCLGLYAQAFT